MTLENLGETLHQLRQWGWPLSVTELQVAHSDELASFTGLKPLRGVFLVRADKPDAYSGTDLVAEYFLGDARLTVRVSVSGSDIGTPDYDSFAWQVLDTLAGNAAAEVADGCFAVTRDPRQKL